MDYLGDEILTEILSRLPVKSLMQLKCIKKRYNSLISSPYFANQQLMRSLKKSEKLFLTTSPFLSIDVEKWLVVNVKSDAATVLGYPTRFSGKPTKILGSCHGLLCMIFHYKHWILLNPTIREFIGIPEPKRHGLSSITESFFGFGYDSSTDDYKLIRGACSLGEGDSRSHIKSPPNLDIFSVKSGSWREIKEIEEYRILGNNRIGTYYNGCIYWLTEDVKPHCRYRNYSSDDYVQYYDRALSFDLCKEKLSEVGLPELDYYGEDQFRLQGLSTFGGHLLLYGAAAKRHIAGWILTELNGMQTWKKVYNYFMGEKPMMRSFTPGAKVSWITTDGKIVANFCILNWSSMQSYDPNRDEYKYEDLAKDIHHIESSSYVESLVSPLSIFRKNQCHMKLRPRSKQKLRLTI